MIANIGCLVEAARRKGLKVEFIDKNHNFVSVEGSYFANCAVPINTEDVHKICKDKEFSYCLLKDVVNMPRSRGYFDPARKEFDKYIDHKTQKEIVGDILEHFSFPVIVKRNNGYASSNVFLCQTEAVVSQAISAIFNERSRHYDFGALAQEYVKSKREYRVVSLFGQIALAYYWDEGKAVLCEDEEKIAQFKCLLGPVFAKIKINWCGFDVIEDESGTLWLIELNSQPGFEHFVANNGTEKLIRVYEKMLERIAAQAPTKDKK